jgi:hypothetical protein
MTKVLYGVIGLLVVLLLVALFEGIYAVTKFLVPFIMLGIGFMLGRWAARLSGR